MAKKVFTHTLSEPLCGETTVKVNINPGDGNLMVDSLSGGEQMLAGGTLQYLENKGLPTRSVDTSNGQTTFTLKASGGQPWIRFPWSACNGATEWQVHLNPTVSYDLTAHSDGGNVKLNLAGMTVTRVMADTGGGNMELILPGNADHLSVTAKSGAGNVVVQMPGDIAAKIHATSGLGKVIVDSRFNKIDNNTYQSPDYDGATNKVEITATTGAGNVIINTGANSNKI
jgi:hypothetical protein